MNTKKMNKNNTGNSNTGDWNTGDCNTGDCNTGDCNTGDWNTGDWNTGNCNTGNWNTGYCNTGNWNTGYCNTGNCNTGNCNTGNWNTGDCNTGDWNTGYCNTITPKDCLIFNKTAKRSDWDNVKKPKWIYVSLTEWVSDTNMTDKEKDAYPSYATTGGYLKSYKNMHDAYKSSWSKADAADRAKTFNLPNFDIVVFEEIFGFNPSESRVIIIDGKTIEISEESYQAFKQQFGEK